MKDVAMGLSARTALVEGVNILANAVRCTLGPKGRTVILAPSTGRLVITKDGVSVAKHIQLKDPKQQVGAQLIRDVASQACDAAGDGTTTATVLAQAIVNHGVELTATGVDPIGLKRGLDLATNDVIAYLRKEAVPATSYADIHSAAAISANGDEGIAQLIADALTTVTEDGVVIINESRNLEDKLDFVQGLTYETGYISNAFINSTAASAWKSIDDTAVIVLSNDLDDEDWAMELLDQCGGIPTMIMAPSFSDEVIGLLHRAITRGKLDICPVRLPGFASRMNDAIRDICAYTGATPVLERGSIGNAFGFATNVVARRKTLTMSTRDGVQPGYVEELEKALAVESGHARKFLDDRIARLKGQIATITVGGNSEVGMKERKDRYDDAINAARAAMRTGVLPGGGLALYNVASKLNNPFEGAVRYGYNLLIKACEAPIKQIAANAGMSGDVILSELRHIADPNIGWDAATGDYVNMVAVGIIDPAEVTISAITYASSVAGLILTTDCVITDL